VRKTKLFLLLILAIGKFLGRFLTVLASFRRSIAPCTLKLGPALGGRCPLGRCGRRCFALGCGCSLGLLSGKLGSLALLLEPARFLLPLAPLFILLELQKDRVVVRVRPEGLGWAEGLPEHAELLKVFGLLKHVLGDLSHEISYLLLLLLY
jgi:hypothetical protein